jgi:DnaJ-class molecular chaperone
VEVPTGTQHGDIAVLEDHGLPPLRGGKRGSQHVVFELVVPKDLTEEQLEAVKGLDDALADRAPASARKRPD